MNTKEQFYEQHITPLLDQVMDLAAQGGINIVAVAHMSAEEGSDQEIITGCRYYDEGKNGASAHIVAISLLVQRPPEFALAICEPSKVYDQRVQEAKLEREAAANPNGVAE